MKIQKEKGLLEESKNQQSNDFFNFDSEIIKRNDCISREDAIKKIQQYGVGSYDFENYTPEQAERFVIQRLSELPSVKPVTKWHKFKNGELPPKNGYYLWVAEGGAIEKDFYWDGEWDYAEKYGYKLIAWTELPKWEE